MSSPKLSLGAAILINLNIMLGSGVFINTVLLTASAGALGGAVYVIVALLLLPLIFAISDLMRYCGGTFYDFGSLIHPFLGFIMSWSYFTAKLASCALGIHVFVSLMQVLFPQLASVNSIFVDTIVLSLFTFLNTQNLRFGRSIQYGFIVLKLIPLLFIMVSALFYFNGALITSQSLQWTGIFESIPFVIFAFAGFEASCSLSKSLENPEKDGPRAILFSYGLVLAIVTCYQTSFFGLLGPLLGTLSSFSDAYPAAISLIAPAGSGAAFWKIVTLIGIASSSLGASYGIMYSNSWNLFTLAQNRHIFHSSFFTQLNVHNIPVWCIVTEGIIGLIYLWICRGSQVPLQQISALGSTIAYTACVGVFIYIARREKRSSLLASTSLLSCVVLIGSIVRNGFMYGPAAYLLFSGVVGLGMIMFYLTAQRSSEA